MSMLCVDEFYERNLQGKTKKEILKVIDKLNKEIELLEETAKCPKVLTYEDPSLKVCLNMNRAYVARAKLAILTSVDK